MQTVRTTIRIRKELIDQARWEALHKNTSVQDVVNDTLAKGFGNVSDLNRQKRALKIIEDFRESMRGKDMHAQEILDRSKEELEARTFGLLGGKTKQKK